MHQTKFPLILDVTLRDGGYLNNWEFNESQIIIAIQTAVKYCADIIEIGYADDRKGLPIAASWKSDMLEKFQEIRETHNLALMCRPSVEDAYAVLNERKSLIDLIRIPTDLKNPALANKLADICLAFDIPCTFNLTNISCYMDEQLIYGFKQLSDQVNNIYIADSRGALGPDRVKEIFTVLQSVRNCRWGYHAHNNLGLAKSTTEAALDWGAEMIDGSILGIGLGGRNLDIKDAVALASKSRPELLFSNCPDILTEFDLGVPPPGDELKLYRLTGEKNFKMEWAKMLHECIGLDLTCSIIENTPDSPFLSPDEFKPFINDEIWRKLKW